MQSFIYYFIIGNTRQKSYLKYIVVDLSNKIRRMVLNGRNKTNGKQLKSLLKIPQKYENFYLISVFFSIDFRKRKTHTYAQTKTHELFPKNILKAFKSSWIINVKFFWGNEAWWFLSFRVFGLLFSSLLLYFQHFGHCVLRPSSGISCRTREPTRNFEPRSLFNPWEWLALISLTITWCKC